MLSSGFCRKELKGSWTWWVCVLAIHLLEVPEHDLRIFKFEGFLACRTCQLSETLPFHEDPYSKIVGIFWKQTWNLPSWNIELHAVEVVFSGFCKHTCKGTGTGTPTDMNAHACTQRCTCTHMHMQPHKERTQPQPCSGDIVKAALSLESQIALEPQFEMAYPTFLRFLRLKVTLRLNIPDHVPGFPGTPIPMPSHTRKLREGSQPGLRHLPI